MKGLSRIFLLAVLLPVEICADTLCFSPVREKSGDRSSTNRSAWQSFDYKVQVDDGPVVKPSSEESTPYPFSSTSPWVKVWLGSRIVESFRISDQLLEEGRNCVYFKNLYETWSVVEAWQAKKLCSCKSPAKDQPLAQVIKRKQAERAALVGRRAKHRVA